MFVKNFLVFFRYSLESLINDIHNPKCIEKSSDYQIVFCLFLSPSAFLGLNTHSLYSYLHTSIVLFQPHLCFHSCAAAFVFKPRPPFPRTLAHTQTLLERTLLPTNGRPLIGVLRAFERATQGLSEARGTPPPWEASSPPASCEPAPIFASPWDLPSPIELHHE